jgi:gamma-glutamyltranspeptidase/glutathione hydrolase
MKLRVVIASIIIATSTFGAAPEPFASTHKPVLHGRHWVAITGKPAGAMAGARMFERGGNAIDAACAMLAVVCTMHDDVGWGGETQALIYDPRARKVVGINALGAAPTGATPEFFLNLPTVKTNRAKYPPADGPLAAVTPGNPGGLMVMLAEFGKLSLKEVLAPAMAMADGYAIEEDLVRKIEREKAKLLQWPYSRKVFFPRTGEQQAWPLPGEIWRQPDLLATLQKLVDAEAEALKAGKSRRESILAANERFYRGDIAEEFVRGSREMGGLHTREDLANWRVKIEEPVRTTYRGVEVYKLTHWTQGPAMLQALNILEAYQSGSGGARRSDEDHAVKSLRSIGYNTSRYIHTLYQAMSLAFADRDFYYGDPDFPPAEPIAGLLSKEYAQERAKLIAWSANSPDLRPGNPYSFQGREPNPFSDLLEDWSNVRTNRAAASGGDRAQLDADFRAGTTSIQAADKEGWVISVTPSGGWIPSCIAGNTGVGMSQRMQSFVLDPAENPFNVVAPGKRPRVTLTPTMALTNGRPFLCFSVQGGDTQDQNLLQFFLNVVEFGMTVQEACEAANITSYQMRSSFGAHVAEPGRITLHEEVPSWTRRELQRMGYKIDTARKTSGPITAIYFDQRHGTMWGGASNHGEDYGIAW